MTGRQSQATRIRKTVLVTLGDEARARLREMAERTREPASRVVEDLILAARMPVRRP